MISGNLYWLEKSVERYIYFYYNKLLENTEILIYNIVLLNKWETQVDIFT